MKVHFYCQKYSKYFYFLLFSLITPILKSQTLQTYKVVDRYINVRESPVWSNPIGTIPKDGYIKVYSDYKYTDSDTVTWRKIIFNGLEKYIVEKDPTEHYIEQSDNTIVCSYFLNDEIPVFEEELDDCIEHSRGLYNKDEIDYIIKDILYIHGLDSKNIPFTLVECKYIGDNCTALISKKKSLIVLNNDFLSKISKNRTYELPLYVLFSHEIAHHVNHHSVKESQSIEDEKAADEFTGQTLKALGVNEKDLGYILSFLDSYSKGGGVHFAASIRKKIIERSLINAPKSKYRTERQIRSDLEKRYDDIDRFENDFARVKKNGKYGYINNLGREIIPPILVEAENFDKYGFATVRTEPLGRIIRINKFNNKIN